MASNGTGPRASSVASSSGNSFVEASGYKFSEKDKKQQKVKLKKPPPKQAKGGKGQDDDADSVLDSGSSSPVLPEMDEKTLAVFPDGKPSHDQLGTSVICKHCKRPYTKSAIAEHIKSCLKAKQEKSKKKKEAREAAQRAKEKAAEKEDDKADDNASVSKGDDDGESKEKGAKKSASKAAPTDDGKKQSKKRKAEEEGGNEKAEPKKKKKKENEPKPKVPKPKGPVDVEKQCGVLLPNGAQCARSLTCKSHSMGAKRAVPGRSAPYDILLQAYQKKNQARQQKAAIDANAPLQDDLENNGPVDSDEEKDAVMAAIARSRPQPLERHVLIPTRRKYQLVRMKEMLSNALAGSRGSGLFSTVAPTDTNRTFFPPSGGDTNATFASPVSAGGAEASSATGDSGRRQSLMQQAQSNRAMQNGTAPGSRKPSVTAAVGQ